jgi:two-component system, NtrC family, response regulator AtoC
MNYRFFVVDDDRHYARLLSYRLSKSDNHEVEVMHSGEELLERLADGASGMPDLVLLDIMMPGVDGIEALKRLRRIRTDLPVVMISAQGDVSTAVEAMRLGAYDYITKGQDDLVKLDKVVEHVKEKVQLAREVEALRGEVAEKYGLDEIVGDSSAMEEVYRLIQKTLRGDLTVAIQGESGTGKELVARAIHYNSHRARGPFVVVNCAAIPRELMESEFFGHEKGSFTGAHARHIGKFEQAHGGTLFLDEIGELDLDLQAKLLRALQNHELTRVGGSETITFDCRVISATNKDVTRMIPDGRFREDLYYRLFQFPVTLPPLRERGQDVLVLAHHFVESYKAAHPEFKEKSLSKDACRAIMNHSWPGNVRELKNSVERAILISDTDQICVDDLMLDMGTGITPWTERGAASGAAVRAATVASREPAPQPAHAGDGIGGDAGDSEPVLAVNGDGSIVPLEDLKRLAVERAYELCDGNVDRAAVELGIGRATMYRLLKKYDINQD